MDFGSNNLTIPRGVVMFAPYLPGTMTPGAYVQLGNCNAFALTGDIQSLPHYSSQRDMRNKDADYVIGGDLSFNLTTDDMGATNRALWAMGTTAIITTASATGASETSPPVSPGQILQLGRSGSNPTGVRNVSNLVVANGATTYVAGTDYTVDEALGLVTIVVGGTIPAATTLTLTYNVAASTRKRIASGEVAAEGELKVVSFNPAGPQVDYTIPRVKLKPSGDLALLQDPESTAFQTLGLQGEVLVRTGMAKLYQDDRPAVV